MWRSVPYWYETAISMWENRRTVPIWYYIAIWRDRRRSMPVSVSRMSRSNPCHRTETDDPSTGHILDGRFRDGVASADHPDQTAWARVRAADSFVRSTPFRTKGRVVEGIRPHSTILPVSAVFILDNLSDIGSIVIWHLFRYHKQQSVSE